MIGHIVPFIFSFSNMRSHPVGKFIELVISSSIGLILICFAMRMKIELIKNVKNIFLFFFGAPVK